MPETGPLPRSMDKQFEKLFAVMAGLEQKMEAGQEEMRTGQERLQQEMRSGREEIKNQIQAHVESQVDEIKIHADGCIGKIEEEVQFKPLTFDGQASRTVFKTQFDVVSSTNGWTDFVKAGQLVASLRGSAAEVLQGIPADKLTDLTTIEKASESIFGDSHLTQFYRTELKTRSQEKAFKYWLPMWND
ncbi:hypothetical protein AVEN_164916-1 [Araneus ventricosus]|uniref:Uncharacterized protein n=1 Tax=Araneus ventricosus TaxID=182803 RepID=A0A4Y2WHT1_ARAVE|nr:hypothetical protein AVEN_272462-1 [Araneus ventricosus]GBO35557.1 hypothetical protein AVEN_164916-1 [Araneus ventricosus]